MKKISLTILLAFAIALPLSAGDGTDNVHLFQSFFFDAPIAPSPYVDLGLQFGSWDGGSNFTFGAQGGFGLNDKIEIGANFGFTMNNPEVGDGQSGITDIGLYGRYNLLNSASPTKVSAGAMVTLPIGKEEIGQGNLNFGPFAALRHALEGGLTLAANVGLIFMEHTEFEWDGPDLVEKTKYKTSITIGAGAIYPVSNMMNIVGEFVMMLMPEPFPDFMALSAAVDYMLGGGHIRGGILIGLDDGAPDFGFLASYLLNL